MWQIRLKCQPLLLAPGWVGFLPGVIPSISVLTPTWGRRSRGFQKSLKLFVQKCLDLRWLKPLGVFNYLHTEQLLFELLPMLPIPGRYVMVQRGIRMEDKCWEVGSVERAVVSHPHVGVGDHKFKILPFKIVASAVKFPSFSQTICSASALWFMG